MIFIWVVEHHLLPPYATLYASMWSGLKSLPIKNLEFSMRNNLDISQRHRSHLPIKGLSWRRLPQRLIIDGKS